jgi:hypothetical protein
MLASLPDDADARNLFPMADGLLDYFPNALAEVSAVSRIGNEQHNPGEPLHWARGKSTDHANKIIRHLIDRGKRDGKGVRHSAYAAWRALALLQEECERDGAPLPRNAIPVLGIGVPELGTVDAHVDALLPPNTAHGEE